MTEKEKSPLEKETEQDMRDGGRSMEQFEEEVDAAAGIEPKAKTPEELKQNPLELLNDLTDPGNVPKTDASQPPGSGANEGQGSHDGSINDNDSKNGPAR